MWAVNNRTRFKAARAFARDASGAELWLVAVRATFTVGPDGSVAVADAQEDVCEVPAYEGDPGQSSLRAESDLVRTKPGTDVLVRGQAYAPGGRPATSVDVRLTVGSASKRLRVVGDRVWEGGSWLRSVRPSAPEPFLHMPIRYERAWGGERPDGTRDASNPVGVGILPSPGAPLPNVEYPEQPVASPGKGGRAAGFGPIPAAWEPRLTLAGTYDDAWARERRPLVPRDFQDAHFRCAPFDQQVGGYLRGGEEVTLENLTPEGRLSFRLPRVHLGFATSIDGGVTHHGGHLHTVAIEPDARRLVMVWHTALPCHHTLYTLRETVVVDKQRLALGVPGVGTAAPASLARR